MRRRPVLLLLPLALAASLGAGAQAEAERQLAAALDRVRASLGPDGALTVGATAVDPVTGRARLTGVALRQGARRATAESAELSGLADGRVGEAVLLGLRLDPGGKDGETRIARVAVSGATLPPAGGAWDWSAIAVGRATLEGVSTEGPERGRITIGRLAIEGYADRRLAAASLEGAEMVRTLPGGQAGFRLGWLAVEGFALPPAGGAFDPLAIAADAATLEGMALDDPEHEVTVEVGRLALRGWGAGREASVALDGLGLTAANTPGGSLALRLGRMTLDGAALRDSAAALAAGVTPPRPAPGRPQAAEASGLVVDLDGAHLLTVASLRASGGVLPSPDAPAPAGPAFGKPAPLAAAPMRFAGELALDGVALDLPSEGGAALRVLGYQRFTGSLAVSGDGAEAGGLLNTRIRLAGDGMGALSVGTRVVGWTYPAPGAPQDGAAVLDAALAASFAAVELRFEDDSLAGRLIALGARRAGMPEARFRAQLAETVLSTPLGGGRGPRAPAGKGGAPARDADPPEVAALRQAVARFLRGGPRVLEIAARPAAPVPLAAFAVLGDDPAAAVRALGLTATAR